MYIHIYICIYIYMCIYKYIYICNYTYVIMLFASHLCKFNPLKGYSQEDLWPVDASITVQ